jgi:hypothetical protein
MIAVQVSPAGGRILDADGLVRGRKSAIIASMFTCDVDRHRFEQRRDSDDFVGLVADFGLAGLYLVCAISWLK